MTPRLFLPPDEVAESTIDFDRAADFLEISACFSDKSRALTSDLANETSGPGGARPARGRPPGRRGQRTRRPFRTQTRPSTVTVVSVKKFQRT